VDDAHIRKIDQESKYYIEHFSDYLPIVDHNYPRAVAPAERRDAYAVAVEEGEAKPLTAVNEVIRELEKPGFDATINPFRT